MRILMIGGLLLAALGGAAGAQVAGQPVRISADEFRARLAHPTSGFASSLMPTGQSGANVNLVRRDLNGEVEVHQQMNDIFVAHDGRAVVIIGEAVEGGHEVSPGEWRGGTILQPKSYPMAPGDVLWIPAGRPHQIQVPPGGSFSYLAVKAPNPPAAKP